MNKKNSTTPIFSENEKLRTIQLFLWALKEYIIRGIQHEMLKNKTVRTVQEKQK
jgi:hypothetical protein